MYPYAPPPGHLPYSQSGQSGQAGNPYAPPGGDGQGMYRANVFVPPGTTVGAMPSPVLRKLKLACGIAQLIGLFGGIVAFVAAALMNRDGDVDQGQPLFILGAVLLGGWYLALLAYGILNLVWVYQFWSWIPPEQRHTNHWKKYISPGTALGFMFIPYFNIYWMFIIYLGICDAFDRMRVAYPTDKPTPRNLALAMLIVPLFVFPLGPFLHFAFDKRVEELALEMQTRLQHAQRNWNTV